MRRDIIRKRIKYIAKGITMRGILKILLVLLIQYASSFLFSYLISSLAAVYLNQTVLEIGPFEINYVGELLVLLASLFTIPLSLGIAEFLLRQIRNKEAKLLDVFDWYSDRGKLRASAGFALYSAALQLVRIPLMQLPGGYLMDVTAAVNRELAAQAASGAERIALDAGQFSAPLILLSVGLVLLGLAIEVRFIAVRFIIADDPGGGALFAVKSSWRAMKGHSWEYIVFVLSFAPWYVGIMLSLFILAIFLVPYFTVAQAVFTEYVRSDPELAAHSDRAPPGGEAWL